MELIMRFFLALVLIFSNAIACAEPLSPAEKEMKIRNLNNKERRRIRYFGPDYFPRPLRPQIGFPGPSVGGSGSISLSSGPAPLWVAAAIVVGVASLAVAYEIHRQKIKARSPFKAAPAAPVLAAALPRREISRVELAAEYEAWKRQKKKIDYLAEN
jgi:hypothetical protein